MPSGAIKETRLARVGGGLISIKEGEGRDKRRDGGLCVGGGLVVEKTRGNKVVRVTHGWGVRGGLEGIRRGTAIPI